MARQNVTDNVEETKSVGLEALAQEYLITKGQADSLGKKVDALKGQLFDEMKKAERNKISLDIGTVSLQTKTTEKMNELAVIEFLEKIDVTDPIKTTKYVDLTVLEDAIRRGEVKAEDIEKFVEVKTSEFITARRKG